MILAVIIIIIIVIATLQWRRERAMRIARERSFMSGFWCATRASCDMAGYRDAYLYIGEPRDEIARSRAWIVALKGGRGVINRPFDFDVERAWIGGGSASDGVVCGKIDVGDDICDVAIDLDWALGRMIWRGCDGKPIFVWEKNARVNSALF